MMSKRNADVLMKWDWLWSWLFYATILLSMGSYLFDDSRSTSVWLAWLLSLGMILWNWRGMKWAFKGLQSWEERSWMRLIVIIGDILFWFVLIGLSSAYYLVLFGLFPQVFRNLPIRYAITAVFLLTGAILYYQLKDAGEVFSFSSPLVWNYILGGVGALLFGNWISAIIQQSVQRKELIEELKVTQTELSEAKRREGALEERQRLAGEIHDTLAQGFTSIVMLLEAAEQALPEVEDTEAVEQIRLARDTARNSLEQARRLVWELRPEPLEQANIPEAYKRVCDGWQARSGIRTTLTTTGQIISLHPEIEIALLRTLQEALHNIEKHAKATAVNITLSYMHDLIVLDVTDDGVGFSLDEVISEGHYGLTVMRERIEKLDGSVKFESELNVGTALVVEIPILELG
ncbi:MAG: sensor histidine kinase [Chloroflexi bacterium]|nr:sensor histidine kinase [Chloroflexota bacterium]